MTMMAQGGVRWEDAGFDANPNGARQGKRRRLNPSNSFAISQAVEHDTSTFDSISVQDSTYRAHTGNVSILEGSSIWHVSDELESPAEAEAAYIPDQESSMLYQECCYGMIPNIRVRLSAGVVASSNHLPVLIEPSNTIRLQDIGRHETFQIESPNYTFALNQLAAAKEISLQSYCSARSSVPARENIGKGNRQVRPQQSWALSVIIYGPSELEQAIGHFLSEQKLYLQDPIHCDRAVQYRNPHIIQSENGEVPKTNVFDPRAANLDIERLEAGPGLLSQLMTDAVQLPETEPSDIVRTQLFSHQKQALTFMLRREQGWQMNGQDDIWNSQVDSFGRTRYKNNVNETYQSERPPSFQGGLLADDMGLGKTLSMISVIASNPIPNCLLSPSRTPSPFNSTTIKTTLLIVPLALIQSWENQFKVHVKSGSLKTCVFHGQNREKVDRLKDFDVVITTYHTISAIWRKWREKPYYSGSMFAFTWHRVILDEAHIIQNSQNHLAQSCCALRSTNRWAITGTPIQNKLSDFTSIVAFLQVHPYSDQATFDEDISRPWRQNNSLGFLRLKTLVRAITIARTKDVIRLPSREDFIHHLDFTLQERQIYEDAKKHTVALLQDAASSSYEKRVSVNALQRLNVLRLICSHGLLTQSHLAKQSLCQVSPCKVSQNTIEPTFYPDDLEALIDCSYSCVQCGATAIDEPGGCPQEKEHDLLFKAGNNQPKLCPGCAPRPSRLTAERASLCADGLSTSDSPMSMYSPNVGLSPTPEMLQDCTLLSMPTKIKELLKDLILHGSDEKSVVFSYWTYTLDLIQMMLDDSRIPYCRFDGKMSSAKRTEALRTFQRDPSFRVILVSITCGGAGLDLTAASRAYLMEPHWNPMIEEQALCRVHRVGQKRNVTTIRYLMRDSFEEQVVEIQKRKKLLAKVTFGQDPLEESGIGMSTLQYLKSVLE